MNLEQATKAARNGKQIEIIGKDATRNHWVNTSCRLDDDGDLVVVLPHQSNPAPAQRGNYYREAVISDPIADAEEYTAMMSAKLELELWDEDEWRNHGG